MGIKGLTKQIKKIAPSAIKIMSYQDLELISSRKVYGVDVYSYLYPTQYNLSAKSKGNHIREFMEMIVTWASYGIRLIFVFDGNTKSEAKWDTVTERTDKRIQGQANVQRLINEILESEQESDSLQDTAGISIINTDLNKLGHKILSGNKGTAEQRIELEMALRSHIIVSGDKINDLVTLFQLVGATYIQAKGEADFVLASLYKNGHIDGVISEDCDMLTHGIDRLVRGITDHSLRRVGHITVYSLTEILDGAKMSSNQFIDYCILCGCDYCPKINGVAGVTALKLLRKYSNVNNIVSSMRDGTIKNRPSCSLDEYLYKYERAFRIFSREQETIPEFKLTTYTVADGFIEWILNETNYTLPTLESKLEILQSQEWSEHVPSRPDSVDQSPVKISAKLKNPPPKIKIKAKIKVNMS